MAPLAHHHDHCTSGVPSQKESERNVINFVEMWLDLSFRQRNSLLEDQKKLYKAWPDFNPKSNYSHTFFVSLNAAKKNLLPLPSHRLLPEAYPSLDLSLIGASKVSRASNSGCRMEDFGSQLITTGNAAIRTHDCYRFSV